LNIYPLLYGLSFQEVFDIYEYKFLEINSKLGVSTHFEGYEEIINKQALEGWRFVTAMPTKTQGLQGITALSLVFEKAVSTSK